MGTILSDPYKRKILKRKMKLFAFIAAAFASPAVKSTGCVDGVHPHESDCTKFYQCSHGNRWPDQSCPEGLLFNPDLLVCDWPENVDCDKECADGVHAHESKCDAYYQCSHGHRWPDQPCPSGLLFNADLLVCDWPENVDCGNRQ